MRNQDFATVVPSQQPKGGSVYRGNSILGLDPVVVDEAWLSVDGCVVFAA